MYSALMCEGAATDKCGTFVWNQIGNFVDVTAGTSQMFQAIACEAFHAELQLEVGNDRTEIGVATALTVAVDCPLDLGRTRFNGSDRIGHGKLAVIVSMNSKDRFREGRTHHGDGFADLLGESSTVRIAQDDALGTSLDCCPDRVERIFGVCVEAVEEVFSIVKGSPAARSEVRDSV